MNQTQNVTGFDDNWSKLKYICSTKLFKYKSRKCWKCVRGRSNEPVIKINKISKNKTETKYSIHKLIYSKTMLIVKKYKNKQS